MNKSEDLAKLETLLEYDSRLSDWEKEAFPDMKKRVESSGRPLTAAQRERVDAAWERLGLDAESGAKNLWSSGKVPAGRLVRLPYEDMPRPLKPPGRK